METFYLGIIIFLFLLAIVDLIVGVSNDAVNFLSSAVGSKVASYRTIMSIAALGVFLGATFSNGMMDVARHGIYNPTALVFSEVMIILLTMMISDVILLNIFNTLGLPTSTTVSMVFDLLGGTCAIALLKSLGDPSVEMSDFIMTDKALSVIMAIFLSVAIAFIFGLFVQYITRVIFTFNYKRKMKYFIGIFGGISATAIAYFMIFSGLKNSSFISPEVKDWVTAHTLNLVFFCFIGFTILMQVLHSLKINVFKILILLGTFALALAFAGNDLVNFIGAPLAGYDSYLHFAAVPGADPNTLDMSFLMDSAKTGWYFLAGAGGIMVCTLFFSKQAQKVIKTSVDLARQDEGEESFGSTPIARMLVRASLQMANSIDKVLPDPAKAWLSKRFRNDEAIISDGAAFDLVRASVNLVLSALLISVGTNMKLPLSTTYVTFMVGMGTSLADRAWGRDSAVYRITGVLSVVGGWFITAGAAFFISFVIATSIYYGGMVVIVILIAIAITLVFHGQRFFGKKKETTDETKIKTILQSENNAEVLELLREQTREDLGKSLAICHHAYMQTVESFLDENRRRLRKAMGEIKFQKQIIKQFKRNGTVAICRLDNETVLGSGLYFFQGNDFASDLIYSMERLATPCMEHIENNFNPLNIEQQTEFREAIKDIDTFLEASARYMQQNNYKEHQSEYMDLANRIISTLSHLKRKELDRIRSCDSSIKVSMVYLTVIQESMNIVNYATNIQKVNYRFQTR